MSCLLVRPSKALRQLSRWLMRPGLNRLLEPNGQCFRDEKVHEKEVTFTGLSPCHVA